MITEYVSVLGPLVVGAAGYLVRRSVFERLDQVERTAREALVAQTEYSLRQGRDLDEKILALWRELKTGQLQEYSALSQTNQIVSGLKTAIEAQDKVLERLSDQVDKLVARSR